MVSQSQWGQSIWSDPSDLLLIQTCIFKVFLYDSKIFKKGNERVIQYRFGRFVTAIGTKRQSAREKDAKQT